MSRAWSQFCRWHAPPATKVRAGLGTAVLLISAANMKNGIWNDPPSVLTSASCYLHHKIITVYKKADLWSRAPLERSAVGEGVSKAAWESRQTWYLQAFTFDSVESLPCCPASCQWYEQGLTVRIRPVFQISTCSASLFITTKNTKLLPLRWVLNLLKKI